MALNEYSARFTAASNTYAYITDVAQTGLNITGAMTVEAWFKPASDKNQWHAMAAKYGGGLNEQQWKFMYKDSISPPSICFQYKSQIGNGILVCSPATDFGFDWHHAAVVTDWPNGSCRFFMDGLLQDVQSPAASTLKTGGEHFTIGAAMDNVGETPSQEADGWIDEVRVWNVARTDEQILIYYNRVLTGTETGLVGYWRLENDWQDSSPSGNHLTAVNTPTFATDCPTLYGMQNVSTRAIDGSHGGGVKFAND